MKNFQQSIGPVYFSLEAMGQLRPQNPKLQHRPLHSDKAILIKLLAAEDFKGIFQGKTLHLLLNDHYTFSFVVWGEKLKLA